MKKRYFFFLSMFICLSCWSQNNIKVGASHTESYLHLLKNKHVGIVVNQTAMVDSTHLVDLLLNKGVHLIKVFAPEHGFRGNADAGEHVSDSKDLKTGLPILSLYGKSKEPSKEMLQGIDVMIFDIQDVGVRFYTYISTLHYVMDACAKNKIPLIVLDRPNPNGDYVAGPVLDTAFSSFVGMDPLPIVHGLTVGELAKMINGEGWLTQHKKCNLTVIPVTGWTHSDPYSLPVKPSPNLPTDIAIRLYPSLCFFEPTSISIGRGTLFPFQVIGYPDSSQGTFSFTPHSIKGMASSPKHQDQTCYGTDLRNLNPTPRFTLKYLIEFYKQNPDKAHFFNRPQFFNLLAGNSKLIEQIKKGDSAEEIEAGWQTGLDTYKKMREKYLIYKH